MKNKEKAGTINILAERDRKAEKDYSKYFEQVYQPPSLKEAKNVGNKKYNIIEIFILMKSIKTWVTVVLF